MKTSRRAGVPGRRAHRDVVGRALAAACLTILAACSSSGTDHAHGSLRIPGGSNPAGEAQWNARVNEPFTFLTFPLCHVGEPVKVSAVQLNDARAVKLVDWGWKGRRGTLEDPQPGIATQLGEGFSHKPIDVRCPSRYGALFVLSLERTGPGAGTERSYTITYDGGSLVIPFGIALCPSKCTQEDLRAVGG